MTEGPALVTITQKERADVTDNRTGQQGRGQRQAITKLSGEAWAIRKMEMKLIPLDRSQSAWKPFYKVWRLSQLLEPEASVTAGAESCDRKQCISKLNKEVEASKWAKNTATRFILYLDFPFLWKQVSPLCCILLKFSDQTCLGNKKQKRVLPVGPPPPSLHLPTIMNDPFFASQFPEPAYHEN